jgi:imidazolonepropionase-like amidohydrolase
VDVLAHALMAGSGLDARAILAALTTAPAARWGETARRGRIATGLDADIVALGRDPAGDVAAFTDVRYTLRGGRVVFPVRSP